MYFLQAALRSELESIKITFINDSETKASQTDFQTLKVSNRIDLVFYFI